MRIHEKHNYFKSFEKCRFICLQCLHRVSEGQFFLPLRGAIRHLLALHLFATLDDHEVAFLGSSLRLLEAKLLQHPSYTDGREPLPDDDALVEEADDGAGIDE